MSTQDSGLTRSGRQANGIGKQNKLNRLNIRKDARLPQGLENLESRLLMSGTQTALAMPIGLTAAANGPTSIALHWTKADNLAAGFIVLRSTDGKNFSQIAKTTDASMLAFSDSTVSAFKTYDYKVEEYKGTVTSAASTAAVVTTPLGVPTGLSAQPNGAAITLNWSKTATGAAGFYVLRATDGVHFSQIAKIATSTATSYTDGAGAAGMTYEYELVSYNGATTSAASLPVTATTALAAPTGLTAKATSPTSVALSWTKGDSSLTGFIILRSTDGKIFTLLVKLAGAATVAYTDNSVTSFKNYTYEIQAYKGAAVSPASKSATVMTPLGAPSGLTATGVANAINLSWQNTDAAATGIVILRSENSTTFTVVKTLTSAMTHWSDTAVTVGKTYYYKIEATAAGAASVAPNTVNAAALAPAPAPAPAPPAPTPPAPTPNPTPTTVSIATRYNSELVITANGTSDTIAISQSGSSLSIVADGQTIVDPAPSAGLFIYTRGGTDQITVNAGVTLRTTIESVDSSATTINSAGANVSAWIDSVDAFTGTGVVHSIASFLGGVSKALGASLPDPVDAGAATQVNASLFGAGPTAADINQGAVGDCYFLSSLAAFAGVKPSVVQEAAVDMGDGTYVVQFQSGGVPKYVRVNGDLSTGGFSGLEFAHPGAAGTIWGAIMEKAFAYFRTGANTYASINSGWMGEVYVDLGVGASTFSTSSTNETAFFNLVSTDLSAGKAVTFGTGGSVPNLVSDHAYTLISASKDANGVTHYVVRNPWGSSGDALENAQGYATLTFAQMVANFGFGCQAV